MSPAPAPKPASDYVPKFELPNNRCVKPPAVLVRLEGLSDDAKVFSTHFSLLSA